MFTSLADAAEYAGISKQAMAAWISKYSIGELVDGRWHVKKADIDRVKSALDHIREIRAELRS